MAFDIGNTLHAIETYILKLGLFQAVIIGEPKSPPGQGFYAAIWMQSVAISMIYAGGDTRESHVVTLRVYRDMLAENSEPALNLESEMASLLSKLMESLLGDTDLESTVMSIDAAGMDGSPMSAAFGYVDIGGTMYRIVDISIPMIVNGSSTLVGTGV
tara:strand:- start:212 stop:685 length:474 start_codon:yes stop_codon:yes gene_type:complete